MDRPNHNSVKYFTGTEVEHTPMHNQRTLFVVGVQPTQEIIEHAGFEGIDHIYCGANHSFDLKDDSAEAWLPWEEMCTGLLKSGFWVTLDIDVQRVEGLHESGLTEYNRFIPMISVKIPYIGLLNYNTVLKIDDRDFDDTNPGVWCHSLHDLQSRNTFTNWTKYEKDEILG